MICCLFVCCLFYYFFFFTCSVYFFKLCKKKLSLKFNGDDSLSNDCAEELELLLPFLEKQFNTKDAVMKGIAEEILMSVTRMVLHSESVPSKQVIEKFFVSATTNFCIQRRHAFPAQIIEDAISQRFPTYFIPSVWPTLIEGLKNCTIQYNQSAICDLIHGVLKKSGGFDESCKSVLRDSVVTILNVLCQNLSTKQADFTSKRVKPLLDLMKNLISNKSLVIHQQAEFQQSTDVCKSVLISLKTQNNSLTKLVDAVLGSIDQGAPKGENNKKRHHEDSDESKRNKKKK